MTKTGAESIDAYIAAQPEPGRAALRTVRAAIRRAIKASTSALRPR